MTVQIEIIETKVISLDGFTMVEGFPGLGLVGTIAVKYLSEKLDFIQIGHINSDAFSPILRIHKGIPLNPTRIYASKKHKMILLVAEQIVPRKIMYELSRKVIEWVKKKKIKSVISLAGIRSGDDSAEIYGIAANEKSKAKLKKLKIKTIDEGLTTGITALILSNLESYPEIEGFSILANVKIQADYSAAAAVIKKLDELYPSFEIDVKPLEQEAKKTEVTLKNQFKEMQNKQNELDQLEPSQAYYS